MVSNRRKGKESDGSMMIGSTFLTSPATTTRGLLLKGKVSDPKTLRYLGAGLAGVFAVFLVVQGLFDSSEVMTLNDMETVTERTVTKAIDLLGVLPKEPDFQAVANVMSQVPAAGVAAGTNHNNTSDSNKDDEETYEDHPLAKCSPTAQVRLLLLTQETTTSIGDVTTNHEWVLQSLDVQGQEKKIGGDEYYVTWYADETTADPRLGTLMAVAEDLQHGWYRLDFRTSVMEPPSWDESSTRQQGLTNDKETGRLTVDLVYTCGLGQRAPPTKDTFKSGATSRVRYMHHKVAMPPHRVLVPSSTVDLEPYEETIFFGDVSLKQLVRPVSKDARISEAPYFRDKVVFKHNPKLALDSSTVETWLHQLEEWHGDELKLAPPRNRALVIGSSLWDLVMDHKTDLVQGPDFENHLGAVRHLVTSIRERYPDCHLVWKSPMALHVHRVPPSCLGLDACRNRTRYMSESRSRRLYELQMAVMQDLDVPVLDVYEASYGAGDYLKWSDGQHYVARFNRVLLSWMYPSHVQDEDDAFYQLPIVDDDALPPLKTYSSSSMTTTTATTTATGNTPATTGTMPRATLSPATPLTTPSTASTNTDGWRE